MINGKMLIVAAIIVTTIIIGLAKGALASCCKKRADVLLTYNYGVRVSPRPPGWPQMWLAREIIKSFNENGLIVEKTKEEKGIELSGLPAKTNEAIKFSVSFNERKLKGCVFEFDKKKNFETVQNYYLNLNENNELHTWSLVKDNILVVIEGTMPEKEIQEYRAVLTDME
jgi:hypothetical protein